MAGDVRQSVRLEDAVDFQRRAPWHGQVLEHRGGINAVEASGFEQIAQPMRVADHIHIGAGQDIEADKRGAWPGQMARHRSDDPPRADFQYARGGALGHLFEKQRLGQARSGAQARIMQRRLDGDPNSPLPAPRADDRLRVAGSDAAGDRPIHSQNAGIARFARDARNGRIDFLIGFPAVVFEENALRGRQIELSALFEMESVWTRFVAFEREKQFHSRRPTPLLRRWGAAWLPAPQPFAVGPFRQRARGMAHGMPQRRFGGDAVEAIAVFLKQQKGAFEAVALVVEPVSRGVHGRIADPVARVEAHRAQRGVGAENGEDRPIDEQVVAPVGAAQVKVVAGDGVQPAPNRARSRQIGQRAVIRVRAVVFEVNGAAAQVFAMLGGEFGKGSVIKPGSVQRFGCDGRDAFEGI
ncbi:MAG: hypothetical protein BWZ10_01676 [candidate division BRC1 bacterium ADurb.BinA364]|nr:MAG: hypothetical protein BWZ10_01676 [candidate division BRC1 bacterium ADurb.BinA364]